MKKGSKHVVDALVSLPNIGEKLAEKLSELGVKSSKDIKKIGPAKLYLKMQAKSSRHLPLCYYLYSLEAAVLGIPWARLSDAQKEKLRRQVALQK